LKALIIKGNDIHTRRLETGLGACGLINYTYTSGMTFPKDEKFDFIFLDPSFKDPLPDKLNTDYLFFFDTEDATNHFDKGPAYDQFKDKVKAYAKYNYEIDDRKDGIKNIGIPLLHFLELSKVANYENPFLSTEFKPYLLASPTFIGNYIPVTGAYNTEDDITCLGKFDDGNYMYNQRYDWLLSLRKNKIEYGGGIVFSHNNLSANWQTNYFGNVTKLKSYPLSSAGYFYNLFRNKVSLNPTGHERISFRTFDSMAAGSIIFNTDTKNKLTLINPKEYITIYDGEDLATEYFKFYPLFKDIHRNHQANREVFKTLTQEKLLTLFLNQLE
jgi:hypothetical protein